MTVALRKGQCLLLACLSLLLLGCEGVAVSTPEPTVITIAGATTMRPVLRELSAAFSLNRPDTIFDLRGGGSTLGEEQSRAGTVTLGATSLRPPAEGEPADGLLRFPIGLDGIAVIVHPTNPVGALSLVQVRDIYAGDVLDWLQLGGREGEILLVSREEGSGTRINFEARVMGDTPVSLTAVVMPTAADVADFVALNPQAIGYVSMAYAPEPENLANEASGAVAIPTPAELTLVPASVRVLEIEGEYPTNESVREQRYALVQPLYLTSNVPPTGRVEQFISFVTGAAGQQIVARHHAAIR